MKKKIIFSLFIIFLVCFLVFIFQKMATSDAFTIQQQTTVTLTDPKPILPHQVGNVLSDRTVTSPVIDSFMEKYNDKAICKINYTTIKYNSLANIYYVIDSKEMYGIKFLLDNSKEHIISASVFTGSLSDESSAANLSNAFATTAECLNYKNRLSSNDLKLINSTLLKYTENTQKAAECFSQLSNGTTLTITKDNLFCEIALPEMVNSINQDTIDKDKGNAESYVPSTQLEVPTKKENQEPTPFDIDIGDEFKSKFQDNINENLK